MTQAISALEPRQPGMGKRVPWIATPLECLDGAIVEFYRECAEISRFYLEQEHERRKYLASAAAIPLFHICMDEREKDIAEALGLPPGIAILVPTGGNRIGGMDEPNLVLFKKMQVEQEKAGMQGLLLMVGFVTHFSSGYPHSQSCAAWHHDVEAAERHAHAQVQRINEFYVGRDLESGRPLARKIVAFQMRSDTDTEARVWIGSNGDNLDPAEFAAMSPNGGGLEDRIMDRARRVFPSSDPRFDGLEMGLREALLRQISAMAAHNSERVREVMDSQRPIQKLGHQGTRILVGRGWELMTDVNSYFSISDFSIGEEEYVAGKYVIRNGILEMLRTGKPFTVPFHVNVPYRLGDLTDRGGSICHGLALARSIRNKWRMRIQGSQANSEFHSALLYALSCEHPELRKLENLPSSVREFCFTPRLFEAFRFYISVSPRETYLHEVVATEADL